MKVRLVFESGNPHLAVESENEYEDKMLAAAFQGRELIAIAEFERPYGGGGYAMYSDRHAALYVHISEPKHEPVQ